MLELNVGDQPLREVLRHGGATRGGVDLPWRDTSTLQQGEPVSVLASPFGALSPSIFLNSVSTGVVSNFVIRDGGRLRPLAACLQRAWRPCLQRAWRFQTTLPVGTWQLRGYHAPGDSSSLDHPGGGGSCGHSPDRSVLPPPPTGAPAGASETAGGRAGSTGVSLILTDAR